MNSIFYLSFKKKIFKHFNKIFFVEDETITYFNYSHKNYIYIEKIGNLRYSFHGFYKDDYFVIVIDSYDEELNINIEHKEVIIFKVPWVLKKVNEEESEKDGNINNKFIWSIDGDLDKKYGIILSSDKSIKNNEIEYDFLKNLEHTKDSDSSAFVQILMRVAGVFRKIQSPSEPHHKQSFTGAVEISYFILPIRNKLLNSCILDIEDFKNITKYDEQKLYFSIIDKKKYEENKKSSLIKKILKSIESSAL